MYELCLYKRFAFNFLTDWAILNYCKTNINETNEFLFSWSNIETTFLFWQIVVKKPTKGSWYVQGNFWKINPEWNQRCIMNPRKILHQLREIISAVCFDKYNALSKTSYILSINENTHKASFNRHDNHRKNARPNAILYYSTTIMYVSNTIWIYIFYSNTVFTLYYIEFTFISVTF